MVPVDTALSGAGRNEPVTGGAGRNEPVMGGAGRSEEVSSGAGSAWLAYRGRREAVIGRADRFDEMLDPDDNIRPHWAGLIDGMREAGSGAMQTLQSRVSRLVDDHGITYNPIPSGGSETVPSAVRWGLDSVPLVVAADEWDRLEAGLVQRSMLLDAVLADIYGAQETVRRGLIPPELIFGNPGYLRAAHAITIPGPHQLFMHAADVARGSDGRFQVVADRTQAPSGVGYALADRRVMSRAMPELFQESNPRPLSTFARAVRLALRDAAPASAEDPVVVVLSPGSHSETAFDQAYLATVLGFPLVENADLVVRDGCLWMRSLGKLRRVDVVLRRVDAEFADPLDLRPDSHLGVVGLVEALRRGAVSVVNTLGSGVLENSALVPLLPALSRALLDEDLVLDSVATYWGGDPDQLSHIGNRLRSLVLRSTTSRRTVVGHDLTDAGARDLWDRIVAEPWKWTGQEVPEFSVAPVGSSIGGGAGEQLAVAPAQVGMRLFTVAQRGGYTPMRGGLGQVVITAPVTDPLITVASKDVWVKSLERVTPADSAPHTPPATVEELPQYAASNVDVVSSPRVLGDLFWFGRYTERAEDMTRLLIAARERNQDYRSMPWLEGSESLPILLEAVTKVSRTGPGFLDEKTRADAIVELRSLMLSTARLGSLAQSVDRMQQAARAVRDQLSNDTWAVLNRIDTALEELAESPVNNGAQLAASQSSVLRGLLAVSGLASESMVRDAGWYLMDAGKRIERGLQLTALLSATLSHALTPSTEQAVIDSVLSAAESSVIYRRRNSGRARPAAVAQLLLFDEGNPRALVYQLDRLRDDLGSLPDASGTSRPEQLVEQMRVRLRRVDPGDLESVDANGRRVDLIELVDGIHDSLEELSRVVLATHMSLPGGTQPLWGSSNIRTANGVR
ncbi:circularly permuted type 2 ATP-grasp protein [Rhodococcus sp. 15-649-2-2]|uniref:circularly permuted type 2 ATP-grasp protein n=1 Tax=Rhodococcus sp. 15-649-2-2 TaxID=2023140 RepID=UPI0015C68EDD|nr:circularly permuted type 2 ATP-grasp protein [Rhodococcus sp. 15-649-2-2]